MNQCSLPPLLLQAYADGEAGNDTAKVEEHLNACESCAAQLQAWDNQRDLLRSTLDDATAHVDPLAAMRQIHRRIEERQNRSIAVRVANWWDNLWAQHRMALVGAAIAAALGALAAPGVMLWLSQLANPDPATKTASQQQLDKAVRPAGFNGHGAGDSAAQPTEGQRAGTPNQE